MKSHLRAKVKTVAMTFAVAACAPKSKPQKAPTANLVNVEGSKNSGSRFQVDDWRSSPTSALSSEFTSEAAYLTEVARRLQPAWTSFLLDCRNRLSSSHELNSSELLTELEIVTDSTGGLISVRIISESGVGDFDSAAEEVVRDVGVFPAVQAELISDDGHAYLRWSFASDERQAGIAGASVQQVELPLAEAIPLLLAKQKIVTAAARIAAADPTPVEGAMYLRQVAHGTLSKALGDGSPRLAELALDAIRSAKMVSLVGLVRQAALSTDQGVALAALSALAVVGDGSDFQLLSELAKNTQGPLCAAAARTLVQLVGQDSLTSTELSGQDSLGSVTPLSSNDLDEQASSLAIFSELESDAAVPKLIVLLNRRTPNQEVHLAAARALGFQARKSRAAFDALLAAVELQNASIRTSSLLAIAEAAPYVRGKKAAYKLVSELLFHQDERVRAAAITAAAALSPASLSKALPDIIRRTKGKNSAIVDLSLAQVFATLKSPVAFEHLLELAKDKQVRKRVLAAKGLLRQRNRAKAMRVLRLLLEDQSPEVRVAALPAIRDADQLRPALQNDSSPLVQEAALASLVARFGAEATAKIATGKLATSESLMSEVRWVRAWLSAG